MYCQEAAKRDLPALRGHAEEESLGRLVSRTMKNVVAALLEHETRSLSRQALLFLSVPNAGSDCGSSAEILGCGTNINIQPGAAALDGFARLMITMH